MTEAENGCKRNGSLPEREMIRSGGTLHPPVVGDSSISMSSSPSPGQSPRAPALRSLFYFFASPSPVPCLPACLPLALFPGRATLPYLASLPDRARPDLREHWETSDTHPGIYLATLLATTPQHRRFLIQESIHRHT